MKNIKISEHWNGEGHAIENIKRGKYFCKNTENDFYDVFDNNFITENYILNNFKVKQTESGVFLFDIEKDAQKLLDYLETFFIMEELVK